MDKIPSPYYFVPQQNFVFQPEWAKDVSQDIPFNDGLSGELEIEIEALRPIYVRNQAEKPEAPGKTDYLKQFHSSSRNQPTTEEQKLFDAWVSFCKSGDRYSIPATSVKGAIRNVLKIASMGSFREAAEDDRYSVRDLNLPAYQKRFVTGNKNAPIHFHSKSGWLRRENETWHLFECLHQRVEQSALAELTTGSKRLRRQDFVDTKNQANSVQAKYQRWSNAGAPLDIKFTPGEVINQAARHTKSDRYGTERKLQLHYALATDIGKGAATGRLVFTGQPSPQKHMEFIFDLPPETGSSNPISFDDEDKIIKEFLFVHENSESEGWAHWKPRLYSGECIPVFWLGNGTNVDAIGLAQMFKLPANRTLRDGIFPVHQPDLNSNHDLADLIFGSIHGSPLRGRAAFTDFRLSKNKAPHDVVWTVLGSPKPTFYPNYLEQEYDDPQSGRLKNEYTPYRTLMSDNIQLRGWKRYAAWPDWREGDRVVPERHDFSQANKPPPSFKAATAFAPLSSGTTFKGKLHFHNLKPEELGALVWSIEWGGDNQLRHSLGMGKGLGLGSVRMTFLHPQAAFEKADGSGTVSVHAARDSFVNMMQAFAARHKLDWKNSDSVAELMLLADPRASERVQLRYPKLEVGGANEFTEAKKRDARLALRSYGEVTGKRQRVAWKPSGIAIPGGPASAISTTTIISATPSPIEVEIEVIEKRGRIRAREGTSGSPFPITNLDKHPQAVPGSKWRATKGGTPSIPTYTLLSPIS